TYKEIKNIYFKFEKNNSLLIEGDGETETYLNYFLGNEPSNWQKEVPVYNSIRLKNVSDRKDLILSSSKTGLPLFSGIESDELLRAIKILSNIDVKLLEGFLFAEADSSEFRINLFNQISSFDYKVESQNLIWGTYLGGGEHETLYQIVFDSEKNIFVAGDTDSSNIPVPSGYDQTINSNSYPDIYVAKISKNGDSLIWGTYIGGEFSDSSFTLGLDSTGNVVVGGTGSKNIPTTMGNSVTSGSNYVYIAKLSPTGSSLLWAEAICKGQLSDLVIDPSNDIFLVSKTEDSAAPCPSGFDTSFNGYDDLYIAKCNSNGSLVWGTYLGGSTYDAFTYDINYVSFSATKGPQIALCPDGNIVVATSTASTNIPVVGGYSSVNKQGARDLYIAKISSDGSSIIGSTFLGGTKEELISGVTTDSSGNIIVSGSTRSPDIPVLNGYQMTHKSDSYYDGYIAKLSPDCSSLLSATYFGGTKEDYLLGIDRDGYGNIIFAGRTVSEDISLKDPIQATKNSDADIFFGVLKNNLLELDESSYFGGNGSDRADAVAFDNIDSIILGGRTTSTSISFSNGYDPSYNGYTDIFFVKFSLSSVVGCSLTCTATVPQFAKPNENVNFTSTATVNPQGCVTFVIEWDFGDGSPHSSSPNPIHAYTAEGTYNWRFTVSGSGVTSCVQSGTIQITNSNCRLTCDASAPETGVKNIPVSFTSSSTSDGCSQSVSYHWDFGDGQTSNGQNISHTYASPGTYSWTMTASADSITCLKTGNIEILAERPCVSVGRINFCADVINYDGSKYTLGGNVSANNLLFFTNYVELTKTSSSSGSIYTPGNVFVPNIHGADETVVSGPVTFFVDGADLSLTQMSGPLLYSINLLNLPLEIEGSEIVLRADGVKVSPFINLGVEPIVIARVQSEILLVPNDDKYLLSMEVVAGNVTPSISITSFSVTYEPDTQTITGSASIGLPFLDVASLDASVEFIPGCLNGFSITIGLPVGIPLGPSGLEIDALTLEVDNICEPAHFYIFLGGDIAIESVPSEVIVLQHVGLGYQVPFTLQIDGGSLAFLGYPLSSMGGVITVYPPYINSYGDTNIAGIYTTHISITLDIANFLISGNAYGSFQVPNWSCCTTCLLCKATKVLVRKVLGTLPYTFAGMDMGVSIGQVEPSKWGGSLRGKITVANQSVAVEIKFLNGETNLLIGTNYDNLFEIWLEAEKFLSPTGYEKSLVLAENQESVVFVASGNSVLPEIYLVTPEGITLTKENYSSYQGASYYESAEDLSSLLIISPASKGTWKFGMTNLNQGEGDLFALCNHQPP
ncbi:MAG: PKD domain-containing protein, partial [Acidobacteriota bacterium]